MKVILIDKVDKLGERGLEVFVKSGYARNFLIPKSKAILATKENIKIFRKQEFERKSRLIEAKNKSEIWAHLINKLGSVTIEAKSGIGGKLFGSVGARDIVGVILEKSGVNLDKSQIRLPNHSPLRNVGVHNVIVHLYDKITVQLDVIIVDPCCADKK